MYQLITLCILSGYFNEFASDIQFVNRQFFNHVKPSFNCLRHIQYDTCMFNIIYISLRNTSPKYHPPTPA